MKELITDYWAQISLMTIGAGYFIKIILDYLTKRKEINHSLFQQNRIDTLKEFLTSYSETLVMLNSVPITDIASKKIPIEKTNEILLEPLSRLEAVTVTLGLFLDKSSHKEISRVPENINQIAIDIKMLYTFKLDENTPNRINSIIHRRMRLTEDNNIIITKIIQDAKKKIS